MEREADSTRAARSVHSHHPKLAPSPNRAERADLLLLILSSVLVSSYVHHYTDVLLAGVPVSVDWLIGAHQTRARSEGQHPLVQPLSLVIPIPSPPTHLLPRMSLPLTSAAAATAATASTSSQASPTAAMLDQRPRDNVLEDDRQRYRMAIGE